MGCGMVQEYSNIIGDSLTKSSAIEIAGMVNDVSAINDMQESEIPVVSEVSVAEEDTVSEAPTEPAVIPQVRVATDQLPVRQRRIPFWLGQVIGQGAFGKVYEALEPHTGQLLAVKMLDLSYADTQQKTEIYKEISVLASLKHRNVVRLFDEFVANNKLYIVMEALKYSLSSLTRTFRVLPELLVSKFAFETASALAFVHARGLAHCDVKAANLMLASDGCLKLVDFGSAFSGDKCDGVRGSPYWLAPEILKQENYDPRKADVWSFGATLIELLTGSPPFSEFKSAPAVLFHLSELEKPPEIPHCSKKMRHFLRKVLQINPDMRPTMAEILKEPWLTEEEGGLPALGVMDDHEISDDARDSPEASQEDFFILQESMIGTPDKQSISRCNNSTCVENQNEELVSKPNWGKFISDIAWLTKLHDQQVFI